MASTIPNSTPFSLSEIKELVSFARAEKVLVMEVAGVRFQFSPTAHEERPTKPADKEAAERDKSPHGHFDPDAE